MGGSVRAWRAVGAPLSTPHEATVAAGVLRSVAGEGIAGRPAVTLTHTTGSNLLFASHWLAQLRRAAVRNYAVIATDQAAWDGLTSLAPGRAVRCLSTR